MRLTHFSRILSLAAGLSMGSAAALACTGANPASSAHKENLVRMQRAFERFKNMNRAPQAAAKPKDFRPPTMVGMWMTSFLSDGEVVDAGFDVWNADGSQILNDNPAPVAGNICLGIWEQTGPLTYSLKHPSWIFDPETNTNLVGVLYILETVTLDPSGDKFTGKATYEGYDLDGNHVFHDSGEVSGERVKMDPPPDAGNMPNIRVGPFAAAVGLKR